MKHHAHGYTWFEVIGATLVVLVVFVGAVAASEPFRRFEIARDEARLSDLDAYQRAVLELSYTDWATYDDLVTEVSKGRVMLGEGEGCTYGGGLCGEGSVTGKCLNMADFDVDELMAQTEVEGDYYAEVREDRLVFGACDPEAREVLEVSSEIQ